MSKKNVAFLKEENLLTLLSQNNFIVPEIQREYVWGENEKVITDFLKDLKSKIGICCSNCNLPSTENKINVGFLYSYKPEYVKIEHERFLDENIIDGQQRFTTLFLLLFFSAIKEVKKDGKNRKEEFLTLIRFEEKLKMCFDFKVRDLTRIFLLELIEKVDNTDQLIEIDKQTWFLKDYKNDLSIRAMQKALGYIQDIFSDNTRYFNHLINYIVFWHFKTEVTSQGEELYITMNARGEELADNEVTKAALMVNGSELYEWGKNWEEWQQFFWINRDKKDRNPSADKGFNGFLACISGLEFYLKDRVDEKPERDIRKLLSLHKVKKYYNALKFLIDSKNQFTLSYSYSDWVDKCLDEVWFIFNNNQTDWFADYQDKNKSTERKRMVFIWSWLYYIIKIKEENKAIDINEVFRLLRFFYIRYNNNNRSVSTLKETIEEFLHHGILSYSNHFVELGVLFPEEETDSKYRTTEESIKNSYLLSQFNNPEVMKIEELIWQIEDHPLNLDGSDVGNLNISHLIDLKETTTIAELERLINCFNQYFPKGSKTGSSILKTILLHYGDFWKDTSYYNKRIDFSDWKRNIRKPEFKLFLNELSNYTPEQFIETLKTKFLLNNQEIINNSNIALPEGIPLRCKLIYYSLLISYEELWSEGEKMIICDEIGHSRLFKDENQIIYNSKGNFKGDWGNTDLWILANDEFENPLGKIKSLLI